MKNILKWMLLFFVLLFVGTKSFGSPDISGEKTMTDTQKQTIQTSQQFTADELWEKLLKVVELPNGYVTKEQLESIFGVKLNLEEKKPYPNSYRGKRYQVSDDLNFYMHIIDNGPTDSSFFFGWKSPSEERFVVFPRPPSGICINAIETMPNIAQRGWELKRETRDIRDILDWNDYRKGESGVLKIEFFPRDHCLASIRMFTSKDADFWVR
ncbi:MAG: hypothetical protein PHY62_09605 [Gallionella sp.]|nr:hypothetical protein [Gallionella sp.]